MTDGRWVVAGVDRNALRPLRATHTADNLLIIGSETGMVHVPESTVVRKGRIGPGQMIAVDLDEGVLFDDMAIKDRIAAERPLWRMGEGFPRPRPTCQSPDAPLPGWSRAELTRRQVAAGVSAGGYGADPRPYGRGCEGSDRLHGRRRAARRHLRQVAPDQPVLPAEFQPGDEPADRLLRETRVMSLKTRFGNLANILDTDAQRIQYPGAGSARAQWQRVGDA